MQRYIAAMFLATTNRAKQLLFLTYLGRVTAEELRRGQQEAAALMAELKPGFRVLADMDRMGSMDADCAPEIGKLMELCEEKGVELVVRVISDPGKDIGMNILAIFHYQKPLQMITCENMREAAEALAL